MIRRPRSGVPLIGGAEMIWLLNIAESEFFTAVIICALIIGVRRAFKEKITYRSFGLLLVIWASVVVLHIATMKPTDRLSSPLVGAPATAEEAQDTKDTATLLANKPALSRPVWLTST